MVAERTTALSVVSDVQAHPRNMEHVLLTLPKAYVAYFTDFVPISYQEGKKFLLLILQKFSCFQLIYNILSILPQTTMSFNFLSCQNSSLNVLILLNVLQNTFCDMKGIVFALSGKCNIRISQS